MRFLRKAYCAVWDRLFGENVFFIVVAVILAVTSCSKFFSVIFTPDLEFKPDPIFAFWSQRTLLFAVGVIEALVAIYLVRSRSRQGRYASVLVLALCFLFYRGSLLSIGMKKCGCLGTLPESPLINILLWLCLGYMLFGGSTGLLTVPPADKTVKAT